jgi:hypothetical protein
MLEIARDEKTGVRGAFITDDNGLLKPNPKMVAILNEFVSPCKSTGVSRVREWDTTPQEYFEKYTKFIEENSGKTVPELNK